MPASSHTSDFDSESPRHSDASVSVSSDWPSEPRLRGLRWRVLLGVLPSCPTTIEALRRAAANSRRRYADLRRRLLVSPHMIGNLQNGENLNVHNPLSQDPDSIWGHYFKNTELEKTIENDIARLHPEHGSFFQSSFCQLIMKRILMVWSLGHTQHGYKQGMHELLAPLVYVIHLDVTHLAQVRQWYEDPFEDRFNFLNEDKGTESRLMACNFQECSSFNFLVENEEWIHKVHPDDLTLVEPDEFGFNLRTMLHGSDSYGAEGELGSLLSGRFMEHDAYSMFDALLGGHNGEVALADYFLASNEGKTSTSSVLEASASMYNILVAIDAPLYIHLLEIGVEPQFFALRWFRVLFCREFDLEMVLHLWDAIFAASCHDGLQPGKGEQLIDVSTSPRASFILNFSVSMILHLRSSLLAAPNATVCLQKLLNFPKHVDVRSLIENAKRLWMLREASSRTVSKSAIRQTGILNRVRASRHKSKPPSPSFHVHTPSPNKGLQQHNSGSAENSRHSQTESYWEERWVSSVIAKDVIEDLHKEAGVNQSRPGSGNLDMIPEGNFTGSNSKNCSASNGILPAEGNNQPARRSLFATLWKGASQLMSFEIRRPNADATSLESKLCSNIEVLDANDQIEEAIISMAVGSGQQKEDPSQGCPISEGGSEAGTSDLWTSDDGENSYFGDEEGKSHFDAEIRTISACEEVSSHPLQPAECTGISNAVSSAGDVSKGCEEMGDISLLQDSREAKKGEDKELVLKITKGKHSKATLQTLGQSMVDCIQVIDGALSSLTVDNATAAYRETAENLSKALLSGKGHITALSALAELRRISSVLLQI